jgi:hypothetical protein
MRSGHNRGLISHAVSRPGRCVQKIRFQPFPTMEATAWLARHGETRPIGEASRTLSYMRCGMATRRVRSAQRLALFNPSSVVNGWHVEARIGPGGASVHAYRRLLGSHSCHVGPSLEVLAYSVARR